MTIARAAAAAGLMLGISMMMVSVAVAQPKPAQPQPSAATAPAPAATPGQPPAAAPGAAPAAAPAGEPAPPAIGPDGLPVAPPTDAAVPAVVPAAAPVAPEEPKGPEITLVSMFVNASVVVQVVIGMLMIWSIATWSIMFSKLSFFSGLNGRSDRFLQAFRSAGSLQDAAKTAAKNFKDNALGKMIIAAGDELSAGKKSSLSSRVAQRMGIVQAEIGEELSTGMGIFATVGSIAAFVGLFGTVYGIMRSFIGIAQTQTTNLAVVAPGIAEALFATGVGLFAAVPAVIFYNMFARRIGAYQTRMENFANEVLVRVARDFEA